jgi:hypothetical protein
MAKGFERTITYGPEGNPNFPGTVAYRKRRGTYTDPAAEAKAAAQRVNEANKARETEVRGILDEVIGLYRSGGAFGQGVEAQLERERTKTMASGQQALIGSGLFNTTQQAGLAGKFAEEVAMPTRMKLEDLRMDRLSGALGQKAQFIGDIQDQAPDYRLLAQLLSS